MNPLTFIRKPLRILGKGQKKESLKRDKSKFERVDLAIQATMELERAKARQAKRLRKRQRANSKDEDIVEPIIEPSTKKPKQDWRIPTEEEEEEEASYKRFLTGFINQHGRLPNSSDEDPQMADFEGYLPGLRRVANGG